MPRPSGELSPRVAVAPANGFPQQLRGVGELQLVLDPRAIGLDGLYADIEGLRDATRFISLPQEAEHFELAVAKLLDGRRCVRRAAVNESFRENRTHLRAEIEF